MLNEAKTIKKKPQKTITDWPLQKGLKAHALLIFVISESQLLSFFFWAILRGFCISEVNKDIPFF